MFELTKRAVLMADGVGGSVVVAVVVVAVDGGGGGGEGDVMDGERGGDVEVVVMKGGGWEGGPMGVADAEAKEESRTIHLAASQRTTRC